MTNELFTEHTSPTNKSVELSHTFYNSISRKIFRLVIFILLLIWSAGFSINALFPNSEAAILYPALKKIYSTVCHQNENKLIKISSLDFLVCARCTGIYAGALILSFISLFGLNKMKTGKIFLIISAAPMLIDVLFSSFGVYNYIITISFSTGLFFGSVVFIYILLSIEKVFTNSKSKHAA